MSNDDMTAAERRDSAFTVADLGDRDMWGEQVSMLTVLWTIAGELAHIGSVLEDIRDGKDHGES